MRGAARACSPCHGNLIQYSMEDGATQSLNLGEKSSLWKDWMCLTHFSLLAIESCQASILILNGQCNHLHSALPGVKPNSTLGFKTHYKMRMKKNTRTQEDHGEITGELWWISELNSIINHSRKKDSERRKKNNNHIANKLNNNCISFPHQKTQSLQPWTD